MAFSFISISCNENIEIQKFFKYVKSNSNATEIINYKNLAEDSIFFIHSEYIPSFINENYWSYSNKEKLSDEFKRNFDINSNLYDREILMILFYLNLNGETLSKSNLEKHNKFYLKSIEEQKLKDSLKLNRYIIKNFENYNIGDLIEVKFDVERSIFDESRHMTYPSAYHMINPKEKFEDSLVIQGKLLRKGNFPDFTDKVEFTNQTNSFMFEIEMTEINDTSIIITNKGPTDDLKIGELFYISLEGYGCREIISVDE